MKEKINFRKIKESLENNRLRSIFHKDKEKEWDYYDSSIHNIGYSFGEVLPYEYVKDINLRSNSIFEDYGEAFKRYIEDTLSKNKGDRTAVEFGGPGSQFFMGFSRGFFKKTIGVCLEDIRRPEVKVLDADQGHSVIEADLFDTKNKELDTKISENLGSEKTDLIVSRMMGPLESFYKDPVILDRVIRKWYKMLNKNGLIFAQFEFFYKHMPEETSREISQSNSENFKKSEEGVKEWVLALEKKFSGDEIDIQLDRGVIRIHKKEKAPDELPELKELFK